MIQNNFNLGPKCEGPSRLKHRVFVLAAWSWAASVLLGWCNNLPAQENEFEFEAEERAEEQRLDRAWRTVNESEELIFLLTPMLDDLDKSVMNLELPDHKSRRLFADNLTVIDLAPNGLAPLEAEFFPSLAVGNRRWPISHEARTTSPQATRLWGTFLDQILYFEQAHFKIKQGRFLNDQRDDYETEILFAGLAKMKSGQITAVKSSQNVRWKKSPAPTPLPNDSLPNDSLPNDSLPNDSLTNDNNLWRIYHWRTTAFKSTETDRLLFSEVLRDAIPDPVALGRARESIQERFVVQSMLDSANFKKPHPHFTAFSLARHPGLAVVDLDRDGFDDFYVMDQWGENMFFHNRGDGTFEEIAARLGLNIKDHTSSALFADFDNDGDADVFLGRTLARSAYLVNENGRFVDRSDSLINAPLPYLAGSLSAADYNGDGLLDIYISTYESRLARDEFGRIQRLRRQNQPVEKSVLAEFLPREEARQLYKLMKSSGWHPFVNHYGPPNVLLKNVGGGRFELDKESALSQVYRQTFQAAWADFDRDGDPDVYLANDFAPNNLFRNDGNGVFVDITDSTKTADFGFGMGASWGDYNNDGKQDLYVTNMFSKAGRRITAQLPGLDPRFAQGARGNSLFRQGDGRFDHVSGLEPPALLVEEGGWGWGSQFLDADNDGYLDIFALSGFYTAPKEIAMPVDI